MSVLAAVVVSIVLSGNSNEDAPADFDACAGVDCDLGKMCEVGSDGTSTRCVEIVLAEGEKCSSEEGTLGSCQSGSSCKVDAGKTEGFCSAADNSGGSSGTSKVWMYVALPVVGIALIVGALYKLGFLTKSADLGYGDFLRQYEQLEMRKVMINDVEAPAPGPSPSVDPSIRM